MPRHILVINREEQLTKIIEPFLFRKYSIDIYSHAKEALLCFEKGTYPVAFINIDRPNILGEMWIKKIFAMDPFMTSIGLSEDANQEGKENLCEFLFHAPFTLHHFKAVFEAAIHRHEVLVNAYQSQDIKQRGVLLES